MNFPSTEIQLSVDYSNITRFYSKVDQLWILCGDG